VQKVYGSGWHVDIDLQTTEAIRQMQASEIAREKARYTHVDGLDEDDDVFCDAREEVGWDDEGGDEPSISVLDDYASDDGSGSDVASSILGSDDDEEDISDSASSDEEDSSDFSGEDSGSDAVVMMKEISSNCEPMQTNKNRVCLRLIHNT
jgi:hypothetical protein